MTISCSICLDKICDSQAATIPCGHIFHRNCIRECLQSRRMCPLCNRAYHSQQIIPLFITIDGETEQLILDLQLEISIKTEVVNGLNIELLRTKEEHKIIENMMAIRTQEVDNLTIKLALAESKLTKAANDNNELGEELLQQRQALMIIRGNHVKELKLEQARKFNLMAQVSELKLEVEALKQGQEVTTSSSSSEQQQKEFQKKYKTLQERLEKLADEKNALKHDQKQLEDQVKALTTKEVSESTTTNSSNPSNNKKVDKLKQQLNKMKQEIQLLKSNNLKLLNYKTSSEREVEKLKKQITSNASSSTVVDNLQVASSNNSTTTTTTIAEQKCVEWEKELGALKLMRNRLIRESHKNKAKADNTLVDNTKKVEKIHELKKIINNNEEKLKVLKETIHKLKSSSSLCTHHHHEEDAIVLDRVKQEEMIHYCTQLLAIAKQGKPISS